MTGYKKPNIQSLRNIKIGHKLTFYSMDGCINCAFLLPLLSLADRENLFVSVEAIHFQTKAEYKESVSVILKQFNTLTKNIPSPVILIQKKADGPNYLVKPESIYECAVELTDSLNRLGDTAVIEYMDGELDLRLLFVNLLIKMASNLVLPPRKKISNTKKP